MPHYRVIYNGLGARNALYREQELTLHLRHDWDRNDEEAARVMYLIHRELKAHFSRYRILMVEKTG